MPTMLASLELSWPLLALHAVAIGVLVVLSGTYAGSEPALFSLTRLQVQHAGNSANPFRRLVAVLMANPKRTLAIILLGNTTVNVLLYASTYLFFGRLEPALGVWADIAPAVFSVVVISIFGEAIPKSIGVGLADRLAPYVAALVHFSGYVLGPAGRFLDVVLVEPLSRLFWGKHREPAAAAQAELSTTELRALLEMSRRQGVIDPIEDTLLREVIHLGDLHVRDVMVPRVEVITYDVADPPAGLRELMRETRRKKVPVYEGAVDNIIGLIYAKMLFLDPDKPLRQLLMPVKFVPELATCEQLLHHFRATRTQMAVAVDEFGGMAGLVTLEDVLEAIVGDLQSPDQVEEAEIVAIGEAEYDVSGRLSVHYWPDLFGLPRLNESVATIAGLVAARLGRAPRAGDVVRLGNVELRVARLAGRRVERVRLRLILPADPEPARDPAEARP